MKQQPAGKRNRGQPLRRERAVCTSIITITFFWAVTRHACFGETVSIFRGEVRLLQKTQTARSFDRLVSIYRAHGFTTHNTNVDIFTSHN
jgi:hypothetical protein